jgi:hypothetical protein
VQTAAALAVFGLPVERFLTTTNPEERAVLGALAIACDSVLRKLQERQAVLIVNAMVKARIGA